MNKELNDTSDFTLGTLIVATKRNGDEISLRSLLTATEITGELIALVNDGTLARSRFAESLAYQAQNVRSLSSRQVAWAYVLVHEAQAKVAK